jgi:predicted transcriptional regulator
VRECLDAAQLTRDDLAATLDKGQPYLAEIQRGKINPRLITIAALATPGVAIAIGCRELPTA